jgi:hypothetical protein
MLLLLAASAAVIPADLGPAWMEFSKKPALKHEMTTVQIGTLGGGKNGAPLRYWLRKQETSSLDGTTKVQWAESNSCKPVEQILVKMKAMPSPGFHAYGSEPAGAITLDGVLYRLKAPTSTGGSVEVTSNAETQLSGWVEESLVSLNGCWTDTAPRRV